MPSLFCAARLQVITADGTPKFLLIRSFTLWPKMPPILSTIMLVLHTAPNKCKAQISVYRAAGPISLDAP